MKLDFIPGRDGYHFVNTFVNHPVGGTPVTTYGLRGGMVMSALDYWRSGIQIPSHKPEDFGPDRRIVFDSSKIHRKFIASCYLALSSHDAEGSFIVGLVPDYCRGRVEPTSEKGVRRTITWEEEPMSIEHTRYSDAGRH